jgi:hypothetical protein
MRQKIITKDEAGSPIQASLARSSSLVSRVFCKKEKN